MTFYAAYRPRECYFFQFNIFGVIYASFVNNELASSEMVSSILFLEWPPYSTRF